MTPIGLGLGKVSNGLGRCVLASGRYRMSSGRCRMASGRCRMGSVPYEQSASILAGMAVVHALHWLQTQPEMFHSVSLSSFY